jgi:hypothetical protein
MRTIIAFLILVAGAVAAHAEDADDEQTANILAITSTYVAFCKSLPPKAQITLDYLRSGISQEAREHAGTLAAEATQFYLYRLLASIGGTDLVGPSSDLGPGAFYSPGSSE